MINKTSNEKTKRKYVYSSTSLSRHMIPALESHLPKIGAVKIVKAICAGAGNGWYRLVVEGELGKLELNGCSWGYTGEGCHATRDVLLKLGFTQSQAERLAFETPNDTVGTAEGSGHTYFTVYPPRPGIDTI